MLGGEPPPGMEWAAEEALGLVRRAARRALVFHGAVQLLSLSEHLSPDEVRDAAAMASVLEVMRR